MKSFENIADATSYANRFGHEVYQLKNYVVLSAEEADEMVEAGVPLTIASPEDDCLDFPHERDGASLEEVEEYDESMDGDHTSALESVYGSDENYDIDHHDDGGFYGE